MKKFTSLLIGCSLVLAGAAMAQEPEEQASPTKKTKRGAEKTHTAEATPGANAEKPQETGAKRQGATKAPADAKERRAEGMPTSEKAGTGTDVSGQSAGNATSGAKQQADQRKKEMQGRAEAAKTSATPAATAAASASPAARTSATPVAAKSTTPAAASASPAPSVSSASQSKGQAKPAGAAKKPDPQQVQQIKAQNANFRAQPKPEQVPTVTFNQNYRIQGAEQWQGPQYEVFRAYRPERHDEGWYRSRYSRVELIGGGYYYWDSGYWYPAWGYNPSAQYYAYDGPIYVGQRAEPPDQVIADVQGVLQQMGYYKGEVDGLLGPLTRDALTAYQSDQGLVATAVIDQPTLDSLGMG